MSSPRITLLPPRHAESPVKQNWWICDRLTGCLVLFAVVFGPWAFGTTQQWSITVMNTAGAAAWILLAIKWATRRAGLEAGLTTSVSDRLFTSIQACFTASGLLYCLISAVNARATYDPESWSFNYHAAALWLPHSYSSSSSWEAFYKYLGLAGLFWAARTWMTGRQTVDTTGRKFQATQLPEKTCALLPPRMQWLLWVLSVNGAVLGLVAIIQRASGTGHLLWLLEPAVNKNAISQFGPWAYRANAAQYFNLLWPVTLGLWWTYERARKRGQVFSTAVRHGRHHLLLSCVIIMAVCPIVSSSRGGALLTVGGGVICGLVLILAQWRGGWRGILLTALLIALIVGGGLLLGWAELGPRLETLQGGLACREVLFHTGWRMAAGSPVFGAGPGTFNDLFQLFRRSGDDYWPAQLHNDWLETFITFGWIGSAVLMLGFAAVVSRWFFRGSIHGDKTFVRLLWISLGLCLTHALYDFPLQVHSILTLFVLISAILSCVSGRVATA